MEELDPDRAEEDVADARADDVVPGPGNIVVPTVGLGGSAGSIPALITFFETCRPTAAWRSWS